MKRTMSNTKFIKVAVSERLPKIKNERYFLIIGEETKSSGFFNGKTFDSPYLNQPQYFLEEVPDRESELIEMLKEANEAVMKCDWSEDEGNPHLYDIHRKIETFLEKSNQ